MSAPRRYLSWWPREKLGRRSRGYLVTALGVRQCRASVQVMTAIVRVQLEALAIQLEASIGNAIGTSSRRLQKALSTGHRPTTVPKLGLPPFT